jgi:hypothetical protein
MKFRELLQTEIWSKRTSQKIIFWAGIVFVIASVGFGAWHFVEVNWLTPWERSAGRVALTQIDALQDAGPLSDQEFEIRWKQAKEKVQAADGAAVTYRDNSIQMDLYWYFAGVELERSKVQNKKRTDELVQQGRIRRWDRDEESDKKIDAVLNDLNRARRAALHKELD